MRIQIPDLQGKALYDYLTTNKRHLIDQKKSLPIKSDPIVCGIHFLKGCGPEVKEPKDQNPDIVTVKLVGNTALFSDSYNDVLAPDSWKKTIAEHGPQGSDVIYHLKDHMHTDEAIVGDFTELGTENIPLKSLGYPGTGSAPALVGISDVKKEYGAKTFGRYKSGRVRQHSIGFQYMKLELAVNDKDYKEEFALWNAHYDQIINKDKVDEKGFFWWVSEIKLYEISAVLFGANELTPVLETSGEPSIDTHQSDSDPKPGTLTSDQVKMRILLTKFI